MNRVCGVSVQNCDDDNYYKYIILLLHIDDIVAADDVSAIYFSCAIIKYNIGKILFSILLCSNILISTQYDKICYQLFFQNIKCQRHNHRQQNIIFSAT